MIVVVALAVIVIVFVVFSTLVASNGQGIHLQRHTTTEIDGGKVYRSTATQLAVGQPLPPPVYQPAIEARLVHSELPAPVSKPALPTGPTLDLEESIKAYVAGCYDPLDAMAFESFLDGVAKHPNLYSLDTLEAIERHREAIAAYRNPFGDV